MDDKTWNRLRWLERLDRAATLVGAFIAGISAVFTVLLGAAGYTRQATLWLLATAVCTAATKWHPALVKIDD